jgi:hypothetical protein
MMRGLVLSVVFLVGVAGLYWGLVGMLRSEAEDACPVAKEHRHSFFSTAWLRSLWPAHTPFPARYDARGERLFTLEDLRRFRGTDGGPVVLSVAGEVFDVSAGMQHYGPDAPYHALTGVDASYALVVVNLDAVPSDAAFASLSGLAFEQLMVLADQRHFYRNKYRKVGVLDGWQPPERWDEAIAQAEHRRLHPPPETDEV